MTLSTAIKALAAAEHLAVVSDFDGTLSPFATAIYEVEMNQDCLLYTSDAADDVAGV